MIDLSFNVSILQNKVKVKALPIQATKARRVGRGIALPFHDLGTEDGAGWSAPRPGRFTPGKDPVPIVQEAGWAGLDGCGKSRPTGIRSPDRPARSESLYRLSYPGHLHRINNSKNYAHFYEPNFYFSTVLVHPQVVFL